MEGKLYTAGRGDGIGTDLPMREQGTSKERFIRAIVSTLRTYPKGYATEQELIADLYDDYKIDAMEETRKLRYDRFRHFLGSDECANYVRCMEKSSGKVVYLPVDGKSPLPAATARMGEEMEKIKALSLLDSQNGGGYKLGDKSANVDDGRHEAHPDHKKLSLLIPDDDELLQPGAEEDIASVSNHSSAEAVKEWFTSQSLSKQQLGGGYGSSGDMKRRDLVSARSKGVAGPDYRDEMGEGAKKMTDRTEEPIISTKATAENKGDTVSGKDRDAKLAKMICGIVEYSYPRYLMLDDLLAAVQFIDPRNSLLDGSRIDEFLSSTCPQIKVVSEGSHKHLMWSGDH